VLLAARVAYRDRWTIAPRLAFPALDPLGVGIVTVHHTAHDAKRELPAAMDAFFRRLR